MNYPLPRVSVANAGHDDAHGTAMRCHDGGWTFEFRTVSNQAGETGTELWCDDKQWAAPLFDHPELPSGYRYLDVFHLAHAAVLHWSPNTRHYLAGAGDLSPRCDDPSLEAAVSLLTFTYLSVSFADLGGFTVIDPDLTAQIQDLTRRRLPEFAASDWEHAVSEGISAWNWLMRGSSRVYLDLTGGQLLRRG